MMSPSLIDFQHLAGELEGRPHDAQEVLVEHGPIEAVDHHGAVHVFEDAALDELDLAAAAFLRRGADDQDASLRELGFRRH